MRTFATAPPIIWPQVGVGGSIPTREGQLSSHSQAVTAPQLRVENVPDGIAKKVERQHHEGDGDPREDHQGPMGYEDVRDGTPHHIAPGGRRRGNTHPEEAQGRLNDNGDT